MAAVTTSNPADFANRVQTYFNPKLLEALDYELVLGTYGIRKAYPASGTTPSIRFFRPRAANTTGVAAITEGTTPATLTEVAVGYVDVPLSQRGALATVTDLVQAIDLLNTVGLYVKTMGADAALDFDSVIRDALRTGLNNSVQTTFGGGFGGIYFERFAGTTTGTGAGDDTSAECMATFHALSAANAKFTRARHLTNVTSLKAARVPTIGGKYVAVTPPEVIHDIRQDTDWVNAATQVNNQALYKGGEIMLDGAVFVPHNNPFREGSTYGTYSATGVNFSVFYLGKDAFGCPEHTNKRAGGSQMGPRISVLANADKTDPLNLKTFIAWKAFWGAKAFITNVAGEVPHYLQFRCKSTFA
jgi:N4-gp56 family major capsid protein